MSQDDSVLTSADFLDELHRRGVRRVRCVRFRNNRTTVWSLTQKGTALNVHEAYRGATPALLDAFAVVVQEGGVGSERSRRAAKRISEWPQLADAIRAARAIHAARAADASAPPTHCSATPGQRAYLRAVYRYFNRTRFEDRLPEDVPVRLSRRMRSALGHMLPGERPDGTRYVVEIALNCDLMLATNAAERADTLLHEMAHAAAYLESGHRGHGPSWRAWARRVGCRPTTLYDRPVTARHRRRDAVTRVPPLPPALRPFAEASGPPAGPASPPHRIHPAEYMSTAPRG
jgi:hypothetical protein